MISQEIEYDNMKLDVLEFDENKRYINHIKL